MEEKETSYSLSGESVRSSNSLLKIAQVVVANKKFD